MNAENMPLSKVISIDQGSREHYHVPKYQREYIWGKTQWEKLLQDIDENALGYFMGSIICVSDGKPVFPGDEHIYEVVDGQQRLTTLSLLMMAIYKRLMELQGTIQFEDEEDRRNFDNTLSSLRNKLIKKKKDYRPGEVGGFIDSKWMCFCRVQPSSQNHNLEDYRYILSELGLLKQQPKPLYWRLRSMYKAYEYFQKNIPTDIEHLLTFVSKINQLDFVHISVGSNSDAFILFETLNNRGVPLSPIDIIKNKMLSVMESKHQADIDESYELWQEIITSLPDYGEQERFLRHFYNTFKVHDHIKVEGISRALKSKIIAIYEDLIKRNAPRIFDDLRAKATIYSSLINPNPIDQNPPYNFEITKKLTDLANIGASPAYQVLLYIFSLEDDCFVEPDFKEKAIDLLCKYYVRRNVTDIPGTRDLDQLHIDLIEKCNTEIISNGHMSLDFFERELLGGKVKPASLGALLNALENGIYASNAGMARYLLIKLDELYHTREYDTNLWKRDDKGRFVWTVEHVFPQTENIPDEWIQMIGNGSREKAEEIHEKHVHSLGNLTLSGYNSQLSNAPFYKKQELSKDKTFLGHKINIGYKNGLALNNLEFDVDGQKMSLATVPIWTEEMILARTEAMTNMLINLYKFQGE